MDQVSLPSGCKVVRIVVAGVYNDREDRAQRLGVGDELVTREWYARTLVQAGLAHWLGEDEFTYLPVEDQEALLAAMAVKADVERAEAAEKALQEAPRGSRSKKKAKTGDSAVGMAPSARRKKPA